MTAVDLTIRWEHDHESQHAAATIWAHATAARDGLAEPATPASKLRGIRSRLEAPGASLHLARRDGRPEGFALLVPHATTLELVYLAVHPSAWGAGTAGELLRHVDDRARAGGFDDLELWVIDGNHRAVDVYERSGWRPTVDVKTSAGRVERRMVRAAF